jgi:acetolactate synthase-1/2/3 large subunit
MSNSKIRVADYIASRCVATGATHVFLVTGGGAMHLNDAFGRNKLLQPVCFHHEQGAAIAAEAFFRTSNRLAVLNVTTGPGGINALNGVYGAYVDSLGMLVVSGQVKRETYLRNYPIPLRQLGDQEVDIVSMARPIVKYATVLQDPAKSKEVMDKAVFLATHGRPGPVWIDVPIDIQGSLIDPSVLIGWDSHEIDKLIGDPDITENTKLELTNLGKQDISSAIAEIITRLKSAKRPALMVGNGVRISGVHKSFLALIKKLGIPVVTGWNAHDLLSNDSTYYAGRPGTVGDRPGNFTVQNADFLLVLGCRLNIRQISYNWKSFASKAWKAMVDIDAAELGKPTLDFDLRVHADLSEFLPYLEKELDSYQTPIAHTVYLNWCRERVIKYPTVLDSYRKNDSPINPYIFIEKLFSKLNANDVVVTGNGSACVIGFQAANIKEGQRLFTNSGNASMGYDLPAAIGACLATNKRRVICLAGDGSLMMNIQELQTLVGYGLPVKVIVLNNNGYHSIRQTQQAYFADNMLGVGPDDGVTFPNFVSLGVGFSIESMKIYSLSDWESDRVSELMNSSRPAIIEVILDESQTFSPKLASRKLDDGTMVSPSLDDMAPFLSRDELGSNRLN